MISNGFFYLWKSILNSLPVLNMPDGFSKALDFLCNIVGFMNLLLPLKALVPILLLIITVRKFNVIMAIVNWVIRLIPFIG